MSCDTAALISSSVVEGIESGRAQFLAHNPTIPGSDDSLSTNASNEEHRVDDSFSTSLNDTCNFRKDNTYQDKKLNEISCNIAATILNESDELGGNQPAKDQNNMSKDSGASDSVGHSLSPVTVVSTQHISSALIEGRPQLVDEPDPRLIDALRKSVDRALVLNLEQEVIAFITGTLDYYDTSPLNSYHRMLVHKIAEFYRLTHIVSPVANDCVRLFRGHAARIPLVKLGDMISSKSAPDRAPQLTAVKIMRRKSPSQKGDDGESDRTVDGRVNGTLATDPSKPLTREEKEMAYQLARARIFGDFKESQPESPSSSKCSNEKQVPQRDNEVQDDGFQSRTQYPYRIVPQTFPSFENPSCRFTPNPGPMPGSSGPAQNSILNPAAFCFNPNAGIFIPGSQTRPVQPALSQQYPVALAHEGGYPVYIPTQTPNMSFPIAQPNLSGTVMPPNVNGFTSPMKTFASGPLNRYGNAGNAQHPSANLALVPPADDSNRGYPQFGRIPDQHTGSNATPAPSLPYFGHQNNGTNGTINAIMHGPLNGSWAFVGANSIQQQGRFRQGEAPPSNGHAGNLGSYGVGRG